MTYRCKARRSRNQLKYYYLSLIVKFFSEYVFQNIFDLGYIIPIIFVSFASFLWWKRSILSVFINFSWKLINHLPQSATQVYFKAPILGISDFDLLNFRYNATEFIKILRNSHWRCLFLREESGIIGESSLQKLPVEKPGVYQCFYLIAGILLLILKWISKQILHLFGVWLFRILNSLNLFLN